jgi:uncharacterized protein (TIGR03067 family)
MSVWKFPQIAWLALWAGGSVSGLAPSDPAQDAKYLQGSWKLTRCLYDGGQLCDDVRLTFDGDRYVIHTHGSDETSQFNLGTGGRNTIFVKHHDNPLANKGYIGGTLTGIYDLSVDKLRLCFDLTGRSYPKSFAAGVPVRSTRPLFENGLS